MRFRITKLFYVIGLTGSALAAFGPWGVGLVVVIVLLWAGFYSTRSRSAVAVIGHPDLDAGLIAPGLLVQPQHRTAEIVEFLHLSARPVGRRVTDLGRVLTVVYTFRPRAIRLISARQATRRERQAYDRRRI